VHVRLVVIYGVAVVVVVVVAAEVAEKDVDWFLLGLVERAVRRLHHFHFDRDWPYRRDWRQDILLPVLP